LRNYYSQDVNNSYAIGAVRGSAADTGGLVGIAYGNICNSYAIGNVNGTVHVGGLVGNIFQGNNIYTSFSKGNVTGDVGVGGLAGYAKNSIFTSYSTSNIKGKNSVGGLVGDYYQDNNTEILLEDCASYGLVEGEDKVGSFIGSIYSNGGLSSVGNYTNFIMDNCLSPVQGLEKIGEFAGGGSTNNDESVCKILSGINEFNYMLISTTLQVGINSDSSCQIEFDTNFDFDISAIENNIASDEAFGAITEFINLLSERSTQLGAIQNRLDSALESIEVNLENLVSSRSTIRDADIAEESSAYIRQQILQQASATLLATANQSPSIALQLI